MHSLLSDNTVYDVSGLSAVNLSVSGSDSYDATPIGKGDQLLPVSKCSSFSFKPMISARSDHENVYLCQVTTGFEL